MLALYQLLGTGKTKAERAEYMNWLLNQEVQKNLVYMDEFSVNMWTACSKGRDPVGQRAVRITTAQHGLTFCLVVSSQFGLIHINYVLGGMTQENFMDMIADTK